MGVTAAIATVVLGMTLFTPSAAGADGPWLAQASGAGEARTVTVRGTVAAVDKENRTVTLKGPQGNTLTLDVEDPQKLDVIKVGDPVVAKYTEAVAYQISRATRRPSRPRTLRTSSSSTWAI